MVHCLQYIVSLTILVITPYDNFFVLQKIIEKVIWTLHHEDLHYQQKVRALRTTPYSK
jgi:hypothetical protein